MKIPVDTVGITADELESHPRVSKACEARVEVCLVRERKRDVMLLLRVLEATVLSQVSRQHTEFLNLPGGNGESADMLKRRLLRFALSFGLLTEAEIDSGQPVELDFQQAEGKQAIVQFTARKTGGPQIGFYSIWAVGDSAAPSLIGDTVET